MLTGAAVFSTDSSTYEDSARHILGAVELQTIRERVLAMREQRYQEAGEPSDWTQQAVAKRAGIEQSLLSKIEAIDRPMKELRVRTLTAIIERGLRVTVSSFFAQIEGLNSDVKSVQDRPFPPAEQDARPDATLAFDRLAAEFADSLVKHVKCGLAARDRSASKARASKPRRGGPRR